MFNFYFYNKLFIVDSISFIETNGTFVEYVHGQSYPTVKVELVYVTMDPIGFVFLFLFAIVIIIQVISNSLI